mgnify:CR=1 FL=1
MTPKKAGTRELAGRNRMHVWKTIRIAGDDYPAELVKSRLMKLDSTHIEFVFDQ